VYDSAISDDAEGLPRHRRAQRFRLCAPVRVASSRCAREAPGSDRTIGSTSQPSPAGAARVSEMVWHSTYPPPSFSSGRQYVFSLQTNVCFSLPHFQPQMGDNPMEPPPGSADRCVNPRIAWTFGGGFKVPAFRCPNTNII
jgi:hypothetical protein